MFIRAIAALFSVDSEASASPRVSSGTITSLVDKVTAATEKNQANALNSVVGGVIKATQNSSLVKSPVSDCGTWQNCSN